MNTPVTTNTWSAGYVAEWLSLAHLPGEQTAFEDRLRYHAAHSLGSERYVAREALACIRERVALHAVAGV